MKQATGALALFAARIGAAVGIEGAFLLIGTVLLSIGASYISPAGPWLVVGAISILVAIALALPAAPKPPRAS